MTMADSRDLRWIDDFGDELTMAIAMRDWDEAVNQVEKGGFSLKTEGPAYVLFSQARTYGRSPLLMHRQMSISRPD